MIEIYIKKKQLIVGLIKDNDKVIININIVIITMNKLFWFKPKKYRSIVTLSCRPACLRVTVTVGSYRTSILSLEKFISISHETTS